ncbi:MAG: flavodoxin [Bacteroidales bacterium]|nr:flavodoxin [Bacteroidales bacterium]
MKTLVLFDSIYGNTKIIAETIAGELGENAKALSVLDFNAKELEGTGLLVAGSPINAWKPSERMGQFLASLDKNQLKGIKAASFDTRVNILIHGDAAKKIAYGLKKAGAQIITEPNVFFVQGKEGPLAEGEAEKAADWARSIKALLGNE